MKIGVIGTLWLNTPPKTYGGAEEVVFNLVNGLVDLGHDVTLFGPATAQVKGKIIATVDRPLLEKGVGWDDISYTKAHVEQAFVYASEFDILHLQLNRPADFLGLPLALKSLTPVVTTLHFEPNIFFQKHPQEKEIFSHFLHLPLVSISDSQQKGLQANFIATVYNALDVSAYPFISQPDDYFAWIGKIKPEKGTKEAIQAAKQVGVKLKVMGAVDTASPKYLRYYEEEIKPEFNDPSIEWLGEVGLPQKAEVLGHARAFLNPILWEEPFGMVMAESQATGTPVISFNRGAAPELIEDGKTGFLVEDLEGMIEAIGKVDSLDRSACRKRIQTHFSREGMAKNYVAAYHKTISSWPELKKD